MVKTSTPSETVNGITRYINRIDERLLALEKHLDGIRNLTDGLRDIIEDSQGSENAEAVDKELQEMAFALVSTCFDFHIRFGIYVEQLAGPSPAPPVGGREA